MTVEIKTPRDALGWLFAKERGPGLQPRRYQDRVQTSFIPSEAQLVLLTALLYNTAELGITRAPYAWRDRPVHEWERWHDDLTLRTWADRKCYLCRRDCVLDREASHRCESGPNAGRLFWTDRRRRLVGRVEKWLRKRLRAEGIIAPPTRAPRTEVQPVVDDFLVVTETGDEWVSYDDAGIEPPRLVAEKRDTT